MRCHRLDLAVIALVLVLPLAARGAETVQPVHVHYDAPEGCPTADAFVTQVQARAARMRVADEGEAGLALQVAVARDEGRFSGTLVVADATGIESRREVRGDSCATVVSALALVAALRIDPMAANGASPAEAASAPVAIPLTTPTPIATPAPVANDVLPAAGSVTPPVVAAPLPAATVVPRTRANARQRVHLAAALGVDVLGFAAPGALFGPTVLGEAALDGPGILAPAVRIGGSWSKSSTLTTTDRSGSGQFTWWRLLLEACPLRLKVATGLDLRPCVTSALGELDARGRGTGTSAPPQAPVWFEVGGAGLIDWQIVGPLRFQAEGGFSLPVTRETFYFAQPSTGSESDVYRAPAVAAEGMVSLAVRFL